MGRRLGIRGDLLVPDSLSMLQEEANLAKAAGGCTADQLGEVAQRLGVRYVLLSRYDGRRLDEQADYAERIAMEVAAAAARPASAATSADVTAADQGQGRSQEQWRLRVLALLDLESVIVEKNEGLQEKDANLTI